MTQEHTVVALTLGDPAGIGAELIAKLLAQPAELGNAKIVLIGDPWLWERGQQVADVRVPTRALDSLAQARQAPAGLPLFVAVDTVRPEDVSVGQAGRAGGESVLRVLDRCMDAAQARQIDAICFAPLNKHAMKMGGLRHEDELHHFAEYLEVDGYFCEFNTLDGLWTARVSSHIPLKDATRYITRERVVAASALIYRSLQAAGNAQPRVAVAAVNPHGGDGGTCGREEIDVIAPAVADLNAQGIPVQGPYPADTIFLRARDGQLDAIVTMYHDQGQIAIKLMGFEKGVTVQGGLPVPITTPAHGTAYDIAGRNLANAQAMRNAFLIASRMGASYRNQAAA
ncbi:MAG: 4-hydroxythreonine-4-phosphate dehydrogenase PdxA [Castellaniella sp.]|uniref:4-hydroxythreonine-4-phosphate dehydrogenase PdxA n=1 Tax=Castellaniella sp. TaxID=1955812 RepID=UPI003A851219